MADIDYSKLSEEELKALASGDFSKLSDATLQMLAGEKPAVAPAPAPAAKPAAPAPTPAAPADRRRFPMLPRDVRTPTDVSPGRGVSGLMGIPGGFLDIATGLTGLFGETETSRELRALEQKLAEKAPVKETYEAGKIVPQLVPALTTAKLVSKIPVASKTAQALLQAAGQAGQAYAVTPSAPEPKLSDLVLEKPREEGIFGLGPRGEAALIEGGLGLAGEAIGPIVRGGTDFARSVRAGLTGRIRGVPTTPVTEEEKAALEIARKRGAPETAELSEAEKAAAEARAERNRIKAAEAEQKLALEQQRQALLARKKAAEEAEAKALETVELTPTRGKQELGQRLRDVVMSARKKYLDARNQAIGKFESGDEIPVFTAAKERESVGDFITSTKSFEDLVKYLKDRSSTGDIGLRDLTQPQMDAIDKVLEQITPKKRVIERVVDEAGNVTEKEVVRPVPISFEKLEAIRRLVSGQAPGTPELGFDALKGKTRDGILSKIESTLENFSKGFEDYKAAYAETSEPLDFLKVNSVGKKAATFQKFSQEQFQANPESVLDALLNNPSKTNADNLLKFVGNENKDEIEQVVLEALVNKAGGKASGYTKVLDKYDDFLEAFPTAKARLQEEAGVFEKATAPSRAAFEEATAGLEGIKLARESAKNRSRIASAAFERAESIRVAAKDRVQALNELDEDTLIAVSEAANKIPLNTSLGLAQAAALAAIAGGAGAVANDSPITGILAIAGGALGRKQVKNAFARKRKEVADRIETELRKIITDRSGGRAASIQTRIDNETGIMDAQRIANEALRNLGIKPGTGAVTANMIYKAFATDKGADAASEGASEPAGEEGLVPGEEGEAESAADGQSYDIDAIISSRGAEDLAPVIKSIYEQESSSGKAENLDKENYAGAKGPMQVTRDTFDAMRNKGMIPEDYSFDNLSHLAEAGVVLIQDLAKRYDNDPEKIAAAYYGGPKAVTAQGINRNQRDKRNRKAPTVGQYADQVLARLIPTAEAKGMADGGSVDAERQRVENEIRKLPWFRNYVRKFGEEPNLSETADYDYFTAFKSGALPNESDHWPSYTPDGKIRLKKEGHPTLWKTNFMDATGIDPDTIGIKNEQEAQAYINARRVKKSQGGAVEDDRDYTKFNARIMRALIKRYGNEAKAREVMRTTDGGELLQIMREEESKASYTPAEEVLLRRYSSR